MCQRKIIVCKLFYINEIMQIIYLKNHIDLYTIGIV